MIYCLSETFGGSHDRWRTMADKGQTDTPCKEIVGMNSLFSVYWEGHKGKRVIEKEREIQRERERER